MNRLKTAFLLSLLTVLMVFLGSAIGGQTGMVFAFLMAAAMNFFSYWFSDMIVLKRYGTAASHMFIVNPLTRESVMSLLSTHSPLEERTARLEGMARSEW